MDPLRIIDKYYPQESPLRQLLLTHSRAVARKALQVAEQAQLTLDRDFIYQAAMLHDIGIGLTHAPSILCHGTEPYIRHGLIGAQILRQEGLPRHAAISERHTGAGLTAQEIEAQKLPLPHRDFMPRTLEEKLVCYADKFFSKSGNPDQEKPLDRVRSEMQRHGQESLHRFETLHLIFSL